MRRQLWNFRMLATKKHIRYKNEFVLYVRVCENKIIRGTVPEQSIVHAPWREQEGLIAALSRSLDLLV
jgi:hypothetical protein